jgi:hypothetical protein
VVAAVREGWVKCRRAASGWAGDWQRVRAAERRQLMRAAYSRSDVMKRAMATISVLIALGATALVAQTPPSFAGKWTLVPDANAPAGGGRGMGGLGQTATVTQDANALTIARTTQMGDFTATYKLDGTESKNTLNIQGNPMEQVSIAKWDAGKLKINTTMNFQGQPVETSMVLSLDPSGDLLVESTRPDFQGGGAPITTKSRYKKN